jgi:hypothetical protein
MAQSSFSPPAVFLLFVLAFVPGGLVSSQKADSDLGRQVPTLVQEHGFVGVIFPAKMKAFQRQFPKDVRFWTPSESDIIMAERELVPFLQNANDPRVSDILRAISTYKRQYSGIVLNERKLIHINLFCETDARNWTRQEVVVLDGGPCYFNLRFSIETKTFSHLQINGRA